MDIIANILNAANHGARKTHIMYRCNLSYKQLHVYLAFLRDRKLLKRSPTSTAEGSGSFAYRTTKKGMAFLRAYSSLHALLSSSQLEAEE